MSTEKHAVVVACLGAPSTLSEVRPFLKQLFQDPDIFHVPFGNIGQRFFSSLVATLRTPVSRRHYAAIGDGSPLLANTLAQAEKLGRFLRKRGDFTVFTAQRYWHPFLAKIAAQIRAESFDTVTLLPLYPHYSTTTTLSIINEWNRQADELPEPIIVEQFYREEGYLNACVKQITKTLNEFDVPPHILFSAHAIPVKRVMNGDPYEAEIRECMEMIMDRLGQEYSYSLSYQSKIGPVKWLSPSVQTTIDGLVSEGIRHVLVFPLSFVSEHVETLYELDIKIRDYALGKGIIQFERANTVQDADEFIRSLERLVLSHIQ